MMRAERTAAAFYARFASIPDLRTVDQPTFQRLVAQFGRVAALDSNAKQWLKGLSFSLDTLAPDGIFSAWLHDLHRFVRQTLTSLLKHESVAVWPRSRMPTIDFGNDLRDRKGRRVVEWPGHELPAPAWHLNRNRLVQEWRMTEPEPFQVHVIQFVTLLFVQPFPFGCCPTCGTFFVRVRRQRCCSPVCAATARKPARREYMRTVMQQRRTLLALLEQRVKDEGREPAKTDAARWTGILHRLRTAPGLHVPKTWTWKSVREAYLKLR